MSFESSASIRDKGLTRRCARKFHISCIAYRLVALAALAFFPVILRAETMLCEKSRAQEREAFYISTGVLVASGVLDYHSGKVASSRGHVEANPIGAAAGSFASVGVAAVLGYYLHQRGGRWRWLGSVLMAGCAVSHFWAAHHNYSLR